MKLRQIKSVEWTIRDFVDSVDSLFFVTLTFRDLFYESDCKMILNRVLTLARYYGFAGVWVREYQTSGRVHYHLLASGWNSKLWLYGFQQIKIVKGDSKEKLKTYLIKEFLKGKQLQNVEKGFKRWGKFGNVTRHCVRDFEMEYIIDPQCPDVKNIFKKF